MSTCAKAICVIVMTVCWALPAACEEGARIEWEVANPFRFFTDAADTAQHKLANTWLTDAEKLQPVLAIERKLAERNPAGWASTMAGPVCWDHKSNRHRCPKDANYTHPKSHAVKLSVLGAPELAGAECAWTVWTLRRDGRRKTARSKELRVTEPCTSSVTVDVEFPSGANVSVRVGEQIIAHAIVKVRDLFVVGMGDSFGSGEGNPDIPVRFSNDRTADYGTLGGGIRLEGYPARAGSWRKIGDQRFLSSGAKWLDQACHRSVYSHQLRAALQLAIEDPHRAVTFVGVACSGAEITQGLFLRYKGNEWVPNPPDLSQISAIAQAQCGSREAPSQEYPEAYHLQGRIADLQGGLTLRKCPLHHARQIDLVFVSIGGNDIGFARLVANAVLKDRTSLRRIGGWFGRVLRPEDVAAPMTELEARYRSLERALHNILHIPWDGASRVILTAYPSMALLEDGRTVCPSGRLGMDVLPQFSLDAKRALDGETVAEALYRAMRAAAKRHGWKLADAHRQWFLGRGICAGNAFSAADELRLPRRIGDYWQPYSPENFEPYASRRRWFRTPNDAFLTGNFHVSGTIVRQLVKSERLQWTQLLLASTYSGAFHPTAEGQAAIADSLVREARTLIRDRVNQAR